MTDLPRGREDRIMRDPKKQAQAQERETERPEDKQESFEEMITRKEVSRILGVITCARANGEIDRQGGVVLTLIKKPVSPVIIFNFCEEKDFKDWQEVVKSSINAKLSEYVGIKWEEGRILNKETGEPNRVLGVSLKFFEFKGKGDDKDRVARELILDTEIFETSDKRDFYCVVGEAFRRITELYTIPVQYTIYGGRGLGFSVD